MFVLFGHYVVGSYSIYGFLLPLWYLITLLVWIKSTGNISGINDIRWFRGGTEDTCGRHFGMHVLVFHYFKEMISFFGILSHSIDVMENALTALVNQMECNINNTVKHLWVVSCKSHSSNDKYLFSLFWLLFAAEHHIK